MEGVHSGYLPPFLFLHHAVGTIYYLLSPKSDLNGLERRRYTIKKKKKKITLARSLFKPRKTSYFLMDLRLAISLGSNRGCSTALATYLAVPLWKSRMDTSLGRGALSSSKGGAQAGAVTQCSPLLSPS